MQPYQEFIKSKKVSNFSEAFDTKRLGMHWIQLSPQERSSIPHAEADEEEFVYVVRGQPHVWINGYIYLLGPGDCVGLPAGTGVAHTFLNNTSETIEMVVIGDRTKPGSKYIYPLNPELQVKHKNSWWSDCPKQELGPHDGTIGNLNHVKKKDECALIKNVYGLERKIGFSYKTDTEKFTEGVRLTNTLDLKSLGIWHEMIQPGRRSSWPHAHKLEEEACILLKGRLKAWLNGFVYDINPGDAVFFKPGTNIAHVLINDSNEPAEFLGLGLNDDGGPDEKIIYPFNHTRNEQCIEAGYFWNDAPAKLECGPHIGVPTLRNVDVRIESNAKEFLEICSDLVYQREPEYNLLLGLSSMRKDMAPGTDNYIYLTVWQNNKLIGAVLVSHLNVVLTALDEPVTKILVDFMKSKNISAPGVVAPAMGAEFFAKIWGKNKLNTNLKLYLLEEVAWPKDMKGTFAVAEMKYLDVIADWYVKFHEEILPHEKITLAGAREDIESKIKKQETYIWLDPEGKITAVNFMNRPTRNGTTVSFVYTPYDQRKKGYASALVAHTSQKILDNGKKFCTLYTDASNPTSNKIYQDIGYKHVANSKHFLFL